jgi:hypothetical protein
LVQLAKTIIFIRRSARKNREARQGGPVPEGHAPRREKRGRKKRPGKRLLFKIRVLKMMKKIRRNPTWKT